MNVLKQIEFSFMIN